MSTPDWAQRYRLAAHEKSRIHAAAIWALRVYPGPVGTLLSKEFLAWEEFGYRLGGRSLVMQAVTHVLKQPWSTEEEEKTA